MFRQFLPRAALIAAMVPNMAAPACSAQAADLTSAQARFEAMAVRLDTPSGLPVPRFVSLKTGKTFCRAGPSFEHPVRLTFLRQGLPVVVVAETTDHWRKIRDFDGDECWTHKSKLSGAETALVVIDGLALRIRPDIRAPVAARLGHGIIAKIEKSRGDWRRLSVNGARGWAPRSSLWGASLRN